MIIRIKLTERQAQKILAKLEEDGLPQELFEKLADAFLEEYDGLTKKGGRI